VISASLLIVIIVAIIVGCILSGTALAIVAGLFAVIASAMARDWAMARAPRTGAEDPRLPQVLIVFAVVASLAGSLAAEEITEKVVELSQGMRGALAGLLSAILMAMLMISYYLKPGDHANRVNLSG